MARHWSEYAQAAKHLSDKQIRALDAMAREHDIGSGLDLLAEIRGCSRSKAARMSKHQAWSAVDRAFAEFGREMT